MDSEREILRGCRSRLVGLPFFTGEAQCLIDPVLRPLVLSEVSVLERWMKDCRVINA